MAAWSPRTWTASWTNTPSKPMSDAQLNAFLELLAQLVESKAKTAEEAAGIIREAKKEVEWWSMFKKDQ